MGEYAPGFTSGQIATLDKERIKEALAGRLMTGEDTNGFMYEPAPKEECDRFILEVFDDWVHRVKQLADHGRAMERLADAHGLHYDLREYMGYLAEESARFNDYVYEDELEELAEEIREFEGDGREG